MCASCSKDIALLVAADALAELPDWQTEKRDKVEDLKAWIEQHHHVTEKMLGLLYKLAGKQPSEYIGRLSVKAGSVGPGDIREVLARDGHALVLMSCALVDHTNGNVRSAEAKTRRLVDESRVKVVPSDAFDWKLLRDECGGWDGAYKWCAQTFDAIVLVEMGNKMVARGQYNLAECFLAAGKRVAALRDKLERVQSVEPIGGGWAEGYGRLLFLREPATVPAEPQSEAQERIPKPEDLEMG